MAQAVRHKRMQQPRSQCPQVPLEKRLPRADARSVLGVLSLFVLGQVALMTVIFGGVEVVDCGAACVRIRLKVIRRRQTKEEEERLGSWEGGRHTT